MNIEIDPKLKPLYANLLRLGIGKYLISESFKHLCIENNVDELWDWCEGYVKEHTFYIWGLRDTEYAEEALGMFLMELYKRGKERFIELLSKILIDFLEKSNKEKDISKVIDALIKLGYTEKEIKTVLDKTKEKNSEEVYHQKALELDFQGDIDKKLCFVLMPFDEKFTPIYENIKKTVEALELECKRADEIFGTKPIIEDIWEYIQKARILIADLTGRNPNVFYELGFAHGRGKDVILLTQSEDDVPFDLRHYRHIFYEDSISGADKLREKLKRTLKQVLEEERTFATDD